MTELSILIPARNEEFLLNTIEDILAHIEADTEIITVLDGNWPAVPIPDHPRLTLIHHTVPIGQRAAVNEAARISTAKYVMKLDAHCSVTQGFDRILLEDIQPDWCIVPVMRNLHAFDWVCGCGHRIYQGPTPAACPECGGTMQKELVWIAKPSPQSKAYCFDSTPHFQYFREYNKRPEGKGDLTETMSLQGSCFMMSREKLFALDVCDESIGSWGSQGIEVAAKVWLSGGRVMCDHRTFYAHLFRTQGSDFGFPYPLSGNQVERAKSAVRELFFENKWEKQVRPLSWLVEHFWPVNGWTDEDLKKIKRVPFKAVRSEPSKGVIYYTDNRLSPDIMQACQRQLQRSLNGHQLVSVSLKPLDFGHNITLDLERGYLAMFRQILAGLEACEAEIVYLCEHDIIYHPSHFEFTPARRDVFYYNQNVWKLSADSGQALFYYCNQTSGLCAYRELLLEHYRKRVAMVEANGFSRKMGFEPGTHRRPERVDDYGHEVWMSEQPNIDIRHDKNLTPSRWSQDLFRDKRFCRGWTEADGVPGWGVTRDRFNQFLGEIAKLPG